MAWMDHDLCKEYGIDPVAAERVARRLERAILDLEDLGLRLFGHSGSPTIVMEAPQQLQRRSERGGLTHLCFGTVKGNVDGGDPNYINEHDEAEPF